MNNKIIYGVVGVIVAVGIFFGGMKYGQAHSSPVQVENQGQFVRGQRGGGQGFGGRGANGNFIVGQILSKDDKSITVKLMAGGSKIVFTSPSTSVLKSVEGTAADLEVGTTVMVQGSANADGSVTAKSVQIRPAPVPRANQ